MAKKKKSATDIIEQVLKERLSGVDWALSVKPSLDQDGDRILLITVIIDGDWRLLDSKETIGLARRVLPKLNEIGEDGFPIFSFVAKSELERVKAETG